jgi:hypothetical protein
MARSARLTTVAEVRTPINRQSIAAAAGDAVVSTMLP